MPSIQPLAWLLFLSWVVLFLAPVGALSLAADDSGYLVKYRYGIVSVSSKDLLVGERGGSDGNFGSGYDSFDHGYCTVTRSGTGNLGGECDLPNVRDFGATYLVVKLQGIASCSGSTSQSSGSISLPGAGACNGGFSAEFPPMPLHELRATGRGNISTDRMARATLYMGFRAKTGYVEYAGTANRAFVNFDLSQVRDPVFSAKLNLFLRSAETDFGSAEGKISVHAIEDYGGLDSADYDFNSSYEATADFLGQASGIGYQSVDVTPAVLAALKAGKSSLSFALKNSVEDFDGNSRFVVIGSHSFDYPPTLELKPNSPPAVQVLAPNGAETLSDAHGPETLRFSFSDPDLNQSLAADLFLSEVPGLKATPIALGVPLTAANCVDADHDPSTPNECAFAWNVPALQQAAAFLDVVVRDDAGAESLDSSDRPFSVDGLPPQNPRLKIVRASTNCFVSSPVVDLSLQAEDVSPMKVAFSCDNRAFSVPVDFQPVFSGFNLSASAGCPDADGNRLVYARFIDAFGHQTTQPVVDTVFLDRAAPALDVLSPADGSTQAASVVTLSFQASDAGGIQSFAVKADNGPFLDLNQSTSRTFAGQAPGLHTFTVRARDNAGNYAEKTVAVTVGLAASVQAPVAPPVPAENGYFLPLPPPAPAPAPLPSPPASTPAPAPLSLAAADSVSCVFRVSQGIEGEPSFAAGDRLVVSVRDSSDAELFSDSIGFLSPDSFRLSDRACALLGSGISLRFDTPRERGVLSFTGARSASFLSVKKLAAPSAAFAQARAPSPLPATFLLSFASTNPAFSVLALVLLAGAFAYGRRRKGGQMVPASAGAEARRTVPRAVAR